MKVLDVTAPDFDQNFDRALRLYSAAQDKSGPQQNQVRRRIIIAGWRAYAMSISDVDLPAHVSPDE